MLLAVIQAVVCLQLCSWLQLSPFTCHLHRRGFSEVGDKSVRRNLSIMEGHDRPLHCDVVGLCMLVFCESRTFLDHISASIDGD